MADFFVVGNLSSTALCLAATSGGAATSNLTAPGPADTLIIDNLTPVCTLVIDRALDVLGFDDRRTAASLNVAVVTSKFFHHTFRAGGIKAGTRTINLVVNTGAVGTVSTVAGNATVTGVGTTFTTLFEPGNFIVIVNVRYTIQTVVSNTSLTLTAPANQTLDGVVYQPSIGAASVTIGGPIITGTGNVQLPAAIWNTPGVFVNSGSWRSHGDVTIAAGVTTGISMVSSSGGTILNLNGSLTGGVISTDGFSVEVNTGPLATASGTMTMFNTALNLTGTVAVTAGSNVVTGSGTLFLGNVGVGQYLRIDNTMHRVAAIASNTSLTLATTAPRNAAGQTAQRLGQVVLGTINSAPVVSGAARPNTINGNWSVSNNHVLNVGSHTAPFSSTLTIAANWTCPAVFHSEGIGQSAGVLDLATNNSNLSTSMWSQTGGSVTRAAISPLPLRVVQGYTDSTGARFMRNRSANLDIRVEGNMRFVISNALIAASLTYNPPGAVTIVPRASTASGSPSIGEVPAPTEGQKVRVNLSNGLSEFYIRRGTVWDRPALEINGAFIVAPTVLNLGFGTFSGFGLAAFNAAAQLNVGEVDFDQVRIFPGLIATATVDADAVNTQFQNTSFAGGVQMDASAASNANLNGDTVPATGLSALNPNVFFGIDATSTARSFYLPIGPN